MLANLESCQRATRWPSPDAPPGASDDTAFHAARVAVAFVDELKTTGLWSVVRRFEITLHAVPDFSALLGAEDVLKSDYVGRAEAPSYEQIWASEEASPDAAIAFAAFDCYGAPLLRRTYRPDAGDTRP